MARHPVDLDSPEALCAATARLRALGVDDEVVFSCSSADDLAAYLGVEAPHSAADLFREVGAWEGESTEELWQRLAEERQRGGGGEPPAL